MTEKLILITPKHGNTPCFLIFPFFETFRGRSPPAPYDAAPDFSSKQICDTIKHDESDSYI